MSNIDDAQTTAIYFGKGAALPASVQLPVGAVLAESPVSGTGFQVSANRDAYLYVNITTAAALAIALSADNSTYNTLNTSQSDALGMVTLFVPKGWYVKLTGTMADLTATAILK